MIIIDTSGLADIVMTTNGDMIYYNAGRQRLAKGSDGQQLQLAGGFPSWQTVGASSTDPEIVDMKYSTTIGDYSQPSTAVASSEGTSDGFYDLTDFTPTFTANNGWFNEANFSDHTTASTTIGDGVNQNNNGEIVADFGSSAPREVHSKCTWNPYSTNYVMAATFTLQTSPDNVTWTTRVSQGGDQHSSPKSTDSNFKYTGGDSWRYCKITANVNNFNYGHCQGLFKNGSPTSTVNLVATNAVDDDTGTLWANQNAGGTNPWIYVDNGSTGNFNGIAIYPSSISTETEIKIQLSATTVFSDDSRTITYSNLTNGSWNFIRFNNSSGMRYARIYGSSGVSSRLAINEIKLLLFSDSEVGGEHGHLSISGTDTSLALDGS